MDLAIHKGSRIERYHVAASNYEDNINIIMQACAC